MRTYLINGLVITPTEVLAGKTVVLNEGVIEAIIPKTEALEPDAEVIDAQGGFISPGLVDIHFHGALGVDTMDADPSAIQKLARFCAEHGVTSFYPTTWSAAPQDVMDSILAVKESMDYEGGARILGVHVEGPYIDLEYRGAQLASMVRTPDEDEYQAWFDTGVVKIVTVAPEIEHGFDFIEAAAKQGVRLSVGHSQASIDDVVRAADCGATQATHIFNGMPPIHHRKPATVGGVLTEKRIKAQMICDGVHLHPGTINLVIDAKTPDGTILITDSIRGTALPDGDYEYKGQRFSVVDNVARTPEGGLSGSTLTMDQAIRNVFQFTNRSIPEVIAMASAVPANEMGFEGKRGVIQPGADADLVLFDQNFNVNKTFVNGKCVYTK